MLEIYPVYYTLKFTNRNHKVDSMFFIYIHFFDFLDNTGKKDAKSRCSILNLVSAIFYQIFIFSPNDSPSKTMKSVFYVI